jgi:hypothetical protein
MFEARAAAMGDKLLPRLRYEVVWVLVLAIARNGKCAVYPVTDHRRATQAQMSALLNSCSIATNVLARMSQCVVQGIRVPDHNATTQTHIL